MTAKKATPAAVADQVAAIAINAVVDALLNAAATQTPIRIRRTDGTEEFYRLTVADPFPSAMTLEEQDR